MRPGLVASAAGALLVLALSACGEQGTAFNDGGTIPGMTSDMPMASGMSGMDHGAMGSATADAPYDARFIDSMIEHHTGAISMAEAALAQSERPEIRQLAEAIIRDQRREVEQMETWRRKWFPDLAPTGGMDMAMGDMAVSGDASQPFDQRFITAMIAHHQGAIAMAQDALTKAERPEI